MYRGDIAGDDGKSFSKLVSAVNKGSLIIYPTETIYGIGGIATPEVKKKIFSIKKRNIENPLILIAGSIDKFAHLHLKFTPESILLANAFWPGHLTLILSSCIPGSTYGIRVSGHPFIRLISDYVNLPLYSTSANISGEAYTGKTDAIFEIFQEKIDFLVDYGELPESPPSTVIDASENKDIRVIREGSISKDLVFKTLS